MDVWMDGESCVFIQPVTLLHDGNLLDDLLQIRLYRNLLDGHHLARLLVYGFEHTAIRSRKSPTPKG